MDDDRDFGAISCQRLVDGIVDGLEHHVMKARAIIGVADYTFRAASVRPQGPFKTLIFEES